MRNLHFAGEARQLMRNLAFLLVETLRVSMAWPQPANTGGNPPQRRSTAIVIPIPGPPFRGGRGDWPRCGGLPGVFGLVSASIELIFHSGNVRETPSLFAAEASLLRIVHDRAR